MEIGRRILFNKKNGEIIMDMGEMKGEGILPRENLREGDGDIGILDLEFGAHADEFKRIKSMKVNLQSRELEFELHEKQQSSEEKIIELENQLLLSQEGLL